MFSIEQRNPVVIYHRSGRLMRPSDHTIHGHGLGEVDGILDVVKNFGFGVVKSLSGGLYDPSKNRFYVPFSSGQMRNWAQGVVNTSTLGLVKTDKFFNSNTMKTIGTIAGGIAAAGTAYAVGNMAMNKFGGSSSSVAAPPGTTPVTLPSTSLLSTATGAVKSAAGTVVDSTKSLFSSAPSLDTVSKVLDVSSKVMGGVVGGGQPQYQQGGQPSQTVIIGGGAVDPGLFNPGGQLIVGPGGMPVGYDPYGTMVPMGGGGGGVMMPGGGGFGPPGSEFVTDQGQMLEDPSQSLPTWILVGGGVILLYAMFSGKSKKK